MDLTTFAKRCEILYTLYRDHRDEYEEFVDANDLGVPAAYLSFLGAVELTDKGIRYVEQTWVGLCDMLEIDPDADYADIDQMIQLSSE